MQQLEYVKCTSGSVRFGTHLMLQHAGAHNSMCEIISTQLLLLFCQSTFLAGTRGGRITLRPQPYSPGVKIKSHPDQERQETSVAQHEQL